MRLQRRCAYKDRVKYFGAFLPVDDARLDQEALPDPAHGDW